MAIRYTQAEGDRRKAALSRRIKRHAIGPEGRRQLRQERQDIQRASEMFKELRSAYQAAAAAVAAPALEDYVNTEVYDVAESQARQSYKQALPTIKNISKQLMANLRGTIKESREDAKRSEQTATRAERRNLADVAQLQAQALGDLEAQFGSDLAGSVTSDQELLGAEYQQQARENALAEKAHLRDMARAEREGHRDRMATGQAVRAAALSQAQTNLNDILNEIGLGRAQSEAEGRQAFSQARSAYSADQADRMLQLAQMKYEHDAAQQELRSGMAGRLEELYQAQRGEGNAAIEAQEAQSFAERVTALAQQRAEEGGDPYASREVEFQRVLSLMAPVWEKQGLDVGAISEQAFRALELMRPGRRPQ